MVNITPKSRNAVFLLFVVMSTALLLSGCLGPKTPQEVAKAFWQSVIEHDADDAVKYSTLTDPQAFDSFGMDWHGVTPAWGKIVIDGDQARIETRFSDSAGATLANRHCVTYLVRKDEVWKVDYKMTDNDLHGGALGVLFGKFNQLGNELSDSLDSSVKELNLEMERLGRKLQDMTDSFSQQASKVIEQHARELQDIMRQLEDSINRALQDHDNHLTNKDRQVMTQVAARLDDSSKHLTNPTTKSVTNSNYNMGMAQQRLDSINGRISDNYKKQWQALGQQFETVMREMLDELARSVNPNNKH